MIGMVGDLPCFAENAGMHFRRGEIVKASYAPVLRRPTLADQAPGEHGGNTSRDFRAHFLVDLGGQDEIAFRETVDLVRPHRNFDFSPGEEDVWMVALLLRKFTHAVYELEGFAKVGKLKGLRDVVLLR
jgi:hypothetical protein